MLDFFLSGGPVMYPLLACSLIATTVILERCIFWIKLHLHRNQPLLDEVMELCRQGDWSAVQEKTRGCRDYVVRILVDGVRQRNFSIVKAMESAAAEEVQRMRRFMRVLDTMITVAPLLGIFGTVLGIITSFDMLGTAGIQDPKAVTAGVAQALITTAAGLAIAIFSLFPYNYFNAKVELAAQDMEKYATGLEIVFQKKALENDRAGGAGR
jgi:biopolymer transport protein ExbB